MNSDIMVRPDLHVDGELALAPGRDIVPTERLKTPRLYFSLGVEMKAGDV